MLFLQGHPRSLHQKVVICTPLCTTTSGKSLLSPPPQIIAVEDGLKRRSSANPCQQSHTAKTLVLENYHYHVRYAKKPLDFHPRLHVCVSVPRSIRHQHQNSQYGAIRLVCTLPPKALHLSPFGVKVNFRSHDSFVLYMYS